MSLNKTVLNNILKEVANDVYECFFFEISLLNPGYVDNNDGSKFAIAACHVKEALPLNSIISTRKCYISGVIVSGYTESSHFLYLISSSMQFSTSYLVACKNLRRIGSCMKAIWCRFVSNLIRCCNYDNFYFSVEV